MSTETVFAPLEHSVYLGRERLGRYLQTAPKRFAAFDARDRLLGDFKKQKDACAAIADAYAGAQMSIKATSWAAKTVTGSSPLKCMLLGLANYADDDGVCWPSQETLASDTEQSVDSVQRRLKKLAALGLIRIERREGNRGQWAGKIYYLNMTVAEKTKPQPERNSPASGAPAASDHAATGTVTMPQSSAA